MTERMLRFTDVDRAMPQKRDAEARRDDFDEIYREFAAGKAREQAARCSQCGVPFCQSGCPLQNNIPDWLKLAAEDRMEEAYAVSAATNAMPEICGRICPQDRLCEGACVIEQSGHGTVTIGAIERWITETAWSNGWVRPLRPAQERSESVAIVGAGPAGLAAAEMLRRKGVQVTVYDRYDRPGGLLIYGIPNFKLEKDVVVRRTRLLTEAGVTFRLGYEAGVDGGLAELRDEHDAVLIATGAYAARALTGAVDQDVALTPALAFLTAANRAGLGDAPPPLASDRVSAAGKRVIVIGGGDTAMDCVRTSVRQGARSVVCLYRRDRENMPGSRREVGHAEEEGVRFEWLAAPSAVARRGEALQVVASRMRLGAPDAGGRRAPEAIPGSEFSMDADLVIPALGYEPEDMPRAFGEPDLPVTRRGTLRVDGRTMMTDMAGVFAAGDIVRGASLVVWAVRDGMQAAKGVDAWLKARRPAAA